MTAQLTFKITNLCKSFAEKQVLKNVNLDIQADKSSVIIGSSGGGKSVLIKSIFGLMKPDSGSILFRGQESTTFSQSARLSMLAQCGYLFQAGALFDSLNVQDNITFFAKNYANLSQKDLKDLACQKLLAVGLDQTILPLFPAELSGGMQKRVALARAIALNPKIIFFDEPTTGLDPIMSNVINDLIIKIRDELKATTITITHDMNSVRRIAQNVAFLHQGKIAWHGTIDELATADNQYLQNFVNGRTKNQ